MQHLEKNINIFKINTGKSLILKTIVLVKNCNILNYY